jgi:tryptophan synthase beta chain
MATRKYLLREDQIPRHWYNILADLKTPPAPVLHPGSKKPVTPEDLAPLFPRAIIEQEMSSKREIAIPDEVRAALALWRPSPLYRAHNLERAIRTRSHPTTTRNTRWARCSTTSACTRPSSAWRPRSR